MESIRTEGDRAAVAGGVEDQLGQVRRCYLEALTANPGVRGALHLRLSTRKRCTTRVQVLGSTLGDRVLVQCVVGSLMDTDFETTYPVAADVRLRFDHSP